MLLYKQLVLTQFRNYVMSSFDLKERIIGICGPNGSGKTNLLDAIHYLCFTRSYFSRPDTQNVHHGLQGFRLQGSLLKYEESHELICILRENNKKELMINGELYKKFSNHIGQFPCVMIAPDDVELITGSSEERRKLIDTILSQLNPAYLQELILYTKILQQRNSLLKSFAEQQKIDETLLDILDNQLAEKGQKLFDWRNIFLKEFLPLVKEQYLSIADTEDNIEIVYDSQLSDQFLLPLLRENRQRDLYIQRTGCGTHKDDLTLSMKGLPFKSLASQGQRKSLLFAFKLAEYIILKNYKGFSPILLLDDVFEKLDSVRMHNLLYKVCVQENGQVFITDTHKHRLEEAFTNLHVSYQLIELS